MGEYSRHAAFFVLSGTVSEMIPVDLAQFLARFLSLGRREHGGSAERGDVFCEKRSKTRKKLDFCKKRGYNGYVKNLEVIFMEIGISTHSLETIQAVAALGIKHTFLPSYAADFDGRMAEIRRVGMICDTLHAPFDAINDMWSEDAEKRAAELARQIEVVDRCAAYGVPTVIIHVSSGRPMPPITEEGLAGYDMLVARAREKGIKIAFENLRYEENLAVLMERYPDMGFCWDCGHQYCYTPGVRYMSTYGKRTVALHIHDNRCGMDTDDHYLPFDGAIDFDEVARDLADSGFDGALMLEIGKSWVPLYADMTEEEYYLRAVASAKRLLGMVESYR